MLEALWWGLVGGSTLIVGALIGSFVPLPRRVTAVVMAVGAGVLISAVAYELVGEAATSGTLVHTGLGVALGSVAYFIGDVLVSRAGAGGRKRSVAPGSDPARAKPSTPGRSPGESPQAALSRPSGPAHQTAPGESSSGPPSAARGSPAAGGGSGTGVSATGMVLAIGALLDGVPESAAIGVTLLHGGTPSVAFVAAVALSNLPEGLSSSVAMRRHGHSVRYVLGIWLAIAVTSGLAAAIGYATLGGTSLGTQAFILSLAAGAVLTMLASTMLPEAAEIGGPVIGLATTAGFLASVLLDRV